MLQELITKWPVISLVIASVVAFNILLSGAKASLEFIKDKTVTKVDDNAYTILERILAVSEKVLDMVGYNPAHKDKK